MAEAWDAEDPATVWHVLTSLSKSSPSERDAVAVDFFHACEWYVSEDKVDLAAALVLGPVATALVTSPFDSYVEAGCKAWRFLLQAFRPLVSQTRDVTRSSHVTDRAVSLAFEARVVKCQALTRHVTRLQEVLERFPPAQDQEVEETDKRSQTGRDTRHALDRMVASFLN